MFFLDTDFRITRIAGSLADWWGQEPESLVGKPVTTLLKPEAAEAVEAVLRQVAESQRSHSIASQLVIGEETISVELEFEPVASESDLGTIVGTVHKELPPGAPSSLHIEQLQNFIQLLDDAAVIFELVEKEPIVRAVNDGFEETFGYRAEYLLGQSLNNYIVPPKQQAEATRLDERLGDGKMATGLVKRQTTSGVQEFSYRGIPVDRNSSYRYGVCIYADVTEQQQAKQHLHVLHRVLRHNVRNDLTVVLGMAERILDTSTQDDVSAAAKRILSRSENLASISENARIAEHILDNPPAETIVEVGEAAKQVVTDARQRWPEATIETDIETPVPVSINTELREALQNLVENAVIHNTDAPTVRVSTRTETPIHLSTRATGQNVVITVEDNGPGMPHCEQAVIFDDADVTQLTHGSGLGLWTAKWVVEAADGTLSYSRSNGWTTITVRLPLATDVGDIPEHGQARPDSP